MKKLVGILMVFILAVALCSCAKQEDKVAESTTNAFEDFERDENKMDSDSVAISSGVVGKDKMNFEYNGGAIDFDYMFNASADCVMGLQIFVNGILQEYSVDDGESTTMHKVACKKNKDMFFHIFLTPDNAEKGEIASLVFANIYNPEIIDFSGGVNSFGNNHKISQPMPWGIKMNENPPEKEYKISYDYTEHKFTEAELEGFIRTFGDGIKVNALDSRMFFDTDKDIEKIELSDGSITFNLYGNLEGRYRVSLYGDFERISDYTDIDVKKNTKYSITYNTENFKNCKNIYAVAVALDNAEGVIKSSSYYVER